MKVISLPTQYAQSLVSHLSATSWGFEGWLTQGVRKALSHLASSRLESLVVPDKVYMALVAGLEKPLRADRRDWSSDKTDELKELIASATDELKEACVVLEYLSGRWNVRVVHAAIPRYGKPFSASRSNECAWQLVPDGVDVRDEAAVWTALEGQCPEGWRVVDYSAHRIVEDIGAPPALRVDVVSGSGYSVPAPPEVCAAAFLAGAWGGLECASWISIRDTHAYFRRYGRYSRIPEFPNELPERLKWAVTSLQQAYRQQDHDPDGMWARPRKGWAMLAADAAVSARDQRILCLRYDVIEWLREHHPDVALLPPPLLAVGGRRHEIHSTKAYEAARHRPKGISWWVPKLVDWLHRIYPGHAGPWFVAEGEAVPFPTREGAEWALEKAGHAEGDVIEHAKLRDALAVLPALEVVA